MSTPAYVTADDLDVGAPADDRWPWMAEAVCKAADESLFFDGSPDDAKAVCATCPVQVECLDYALGEGIAYGVFGGLDEGERRKLDREAA